MKTRSQTKILQELSIDFDESSAAWRSNKKSIGNGMYKYTCNNEKPCARFALPFTTFCKYHSKTKD